VLEKKSIVRESFLPCDVEHILNIPLCSSYLINKLVWHHSNNREFTVRSAYFLFLKKQQEESGEPGGATREAMENDMESGGATKNQSIWLEGVCQSIVHEGESHKECSSFDFQYNMCGDGVDSNMHSPLHYPLV